MNDNDHQVGQLISVDNDFDDDVDDGREGVRGDVDEGMVRQAHISLALLPTSMVVVTMILMVMLVVILMASVVMLMT